MHTIRRPTTTLNRHELPYPVISGLSSDGDNSQCAQRHPADTIHTRCMRRHLSTIHPQSEPQITNA